MCFDVNFWGDTPCFLFGLQKFAQELSYGPNKLSFRHGDFSISFSNPESNVLSSYSSQSVQHAYICKLVNLPNVCHCVKKISKLPRMINFFFQQKASFVQVEFAFSKSSGPTAGFRV